MFDHELTTTDASLIAASLRRPAAFAAVFDRHWGAIHRCCVAPRRPGGRGPRRRDLPRRLRRARAASTRATPTPAPWLYGIATNLLRRHFREAARRGCGPPVAEADFTDDALGRVEARALGPELAAALRAVAAGDRDALLLHAWAHLTYMGIAAATGGPPVPSVPASTARAR